ncbi:MAG: prefoldin subunit alpha [Thaumarchaeota archaeon]|nr:prefoldin subunit alpha [Nitrososphaerota archaeon]
MSKEEERINNLVAEVRVLESTYNDLSSRQNLLERILMESRSSLDTIKGLSSSPTEEVLVPVGGGILLRASPPKTDKVLLNIGANVVVEKSREEAEKILEGRSKNIEENIIAILSQRNQIAQRLEADRRTLQAFIDRQEQGQQPQQGLPR